MDAPERGALMLVRFIAAALIGWSVAEFALYWVVNNHDHTPWKILPCVLKALPLLIGIAVLIKSKALAEWVADLLE